MFFILLIMCVTYAGCCHYTREFTIRFPMFDWVGGRTSEMSDAGLLAAALHVFIFRFLMEFLLQGVLSRANINVFSGN